MRVSNRHLAQACLGAMAKGTSSARTMRSLAAYLVSERRTKDAEAILRDIEGLLLSDKGQLEMDVTTARGLSESLRHEIEGLFKEDAMRIIINEKQDPAVIGGVLVETGEKRLDLTVRRQLQRLKEMGVN